MGLVTRCKPPRPPSTLVGAIFWIGTGMAVTLFDTAPGSKTTLLSWMSILFASWTFFRLGGRYVTASGVWSICVGLFGGFAGLYWQHARPDNPDLAAAIGAVFLTHALMYYIFWAGTKEPAPGRIDRTELRPFLPLGLGMVAVGSVLTALGVLGAVSAPLAFTGVVLASVGLLSGPPRTGGALALLAVGALAGFYAVFIFSGFGRLVLSALAFSLVMVFLTRWRTWWGKIGTFIAIPPALVYMIGQREQFGLETSGQALDGIGSVVEPLRQFSLMLTGPQEFDLAWGSTFWAALVTHVPSELWPGKPDGLALEAAWIYTPMLAAIGGTVATLLHGEFVYNFGPLGLLVLVVVVGVVIRFLDLGLLRMIRQGVASRRDGLMLTAYIIAAGGMTDMFWSGTHTFMGRTGTRLLLLFLIFLVWGWMSSARARRAEQRSSIVGPERMRDRIEA